MNIFHNCDTAIEACCDSKHFRSKSVFLFCLKKISQNFLATLNILALISFLFFFVDHKNDTCDSLQSDALALKSEAHIAVISENEDLKVLSYLDKVKEKTQCFDKSNDLKIINHGDFWIFKNLIRASNGPVKCHESVTLSTQGDFTFLDNIEVLADRWRAPISLAVYSPGSDYEKSMASVLYVRNCLKKSSFIKQHVTFHFFFDRNHTYEHIDLDFEAIEGKYQCNNETPPYLQANASAQSYRTRHGLLYHINVARNIAREAATTHFVFASDIELYPNYDLPQKFLKMYADWTPTKEKEVFVLPVFEIKEGFEIPPDRIILAKMLRNETVQVFHINVGKSFHYIENTDEWLKLPPSTDLKVSSTFIREGRSMALEPFYIGTHSDPLFDEHITWEGKHNKLTQAFMMCMLRYDYHVLSDAFLVHKPGIKSKKAASRFQYTYPMFEYIKNVLAAQYKSIFGFEKRCYLHNNE